jgi:endonuclease/exonuclease/phosphatase family metal-dependent hydrolase
MTVSVLQWNIWYNEDLRNIARFLKAQPADVLCLQELAINFKNQTIQDGPAYIAEQLGYEYFYKGLPLENTEGATMMWADGIFSRFPIVEKRWAWTNEPLGGGGYGDEYRTYVEVVLDVEGRELTVGTTHMSYTHRFEETPAKRRETDRLVNELSAQAGQKRPFIFTGDLNAVPGSYTITTIEKLLRNIGPDAAQKTWTTKPFSYNGFDETELRWRLDYIFTNNTVQVESVAVVTTEYSDHLPVLAKVTML